MPMTCLSLWLLCCMMYWPTLLGGSTFREHDRSTLIEDAHSNKVENYNCLAHDIQEKSHNVSFCEVEVRVKGLVNSGNKQRIKQILKKSNSQIRPCDLLFSSNCLKIRHSLALHNLLRQKRTVSGDLRHIHLRTMMFFIRLVPIRLFIYN